MRRIIGLWLFFSFFCQMAFAQTFVDVSHAKWGTLLKETLVSKQNGQVTRINYALLKTKDSQLTTYLKELSTVTESQFKILSREDQMAFLINAYNAAMAKLIIDHFPVTSVKKIGIPFVGPWKNTFISLFGKNMSPDDLEHGTLRKLYKDSRIHFAVNCASVSCPSLRPDPYIGKQLDAQLTEQAKLFFGNKTENSYDPSTLELHLNSILKWFREDFTKTDDKEILTYVAQYIPQLAVDLPGKGSKIKITYNDYDWKLNGIE